MSINNADHNDDASQFLLSSTELEQYTISTSYTNKTDMDLNEYQLKASNEYAWDVHVGDHPLIYPTLGLVSESGEFAGKVKKIFRDANGVINEECKLDLIYELGDVLWYLARCATILGIDLVEVAQLNLDKLQARKSRGTIGGNGDKR